MVNDLEKKPVLADISRSIWEMICFNAILQL